MEAKRQRCLDLFHAGIGARTIMDTLNMPKTTVYRVIKSGTAKRTSPTTPANKIATPQFLQKLKRTVESNPTNSIRNIAKKLKVHERTIRRSLKTIGKRSVVRPPRHLLTQRQKEVRFERGRRLLNQLKSLPPSTVKIFSDKKIFTIDQSYNRRNDRQIVDVGVSGDPVARTKHPASVMMLGIVASSGQKAPPIFIPEGEKVNTEVYIAILRSKVLPWLKKTFPNGDYIFQQDSAPAHASNKTQDWLRMNMAGFWDKNLWPSNSPDLNPLDYSIWSVMEAKACKTPHPNIDSLKTAISKAWRSLKPGYLIKTCRAFQPRLEKMIELQGGLIE
jgi:hypothetical protein